MVEAPGLKKGALRAALEGTKRGKVRQRDGCLLYYQTRQVAHGLALSMLWTVADHRSSAHRHGRKLTHAHTCTLTPAQKELAGNIEANRQPIVDSSGGPGSRPMSGKTDKSSILSDRPMWRNPAANNTNSNRPKSAGSPGGCDGCVCVID